MKKILFSLILALSTIFANAACNFGSKNPYFSTWDSCNNSTLYGYIYFNAPTSQTSCFKYTWKVNGAVVTHDRYMKQTFTSNGTYKICCSVVDTCNKCDTSFCSTRTISCFSSKCNFKSKNVYFSTWDSCTTTNKSLYGYIAFNPSSCLKYTWKINGTFVTNDRYMKKVITSNGTYNICCIVVDTCNKCDTSYCSTKTISCFSSSSCNWSKIGFFYSNNCRKYTFEMGSPDTCISYITFRKSPSGKIDTLSTSRVFSVTFNDTGLYTLKTRYYNRCCNKDTFIYKQIHVTCATGLNDCKFRAEWSYSVNCKTKVATFNAYVSDTSSPYYSYSWNFGDNTTPGQLKTNQTHTYTSSSYFNVCLTIKRYKLYNGSLVVCSDTTICKYIFVPYSCCELKTSFTYGLNSSIRKIEVKNTSTGDTCVNYTWYWGDGSYSSGKNPGYHIYNSNGTFNVCLKAVKCNDTSCHNYYCKTITISTTGGSDDWASDNSISIYPNPSNQSLYISGITSAEIKIVSMTGKVVSHITKSETINKIDVSGFDNGVYFINIYREGRFYNFKFIKI